MIVVSDEFKEAAQDVTKQTKSYLGTDDDQITSDDDLAYMKIKATGNLCKCIMRQLEAEYYEDHNYLNQYIHAGIGLILPLITNKGAFTVSIATPAVVTLTSHGLNTGAKVKFTTTGSLPTGLAISTIYYVIKINANTFWLASTYENAANNIKIATSGSQSGVHTLLYYPMNGEGDVEYIDYGTFKVVDPVKYDDSTTKTKIIAFDKFYEALQQYDLTDLEFPMTLLEFVQLLCTRLDYTLADGMDSFPNFDLSIDTDLFTGLGLSFRDIFDDIAEATGSIIRFNVNDELELIQVSNDALATVDENNLQSLEIAPNYGPITSIVLSRSPQEDNIVQNAP